MKLSNVTGQVLLGLGVAILVALFALVRAVLQHWRMWHVPAFLVCVALLWWVGWLLTRGRAE